MQQCETKRSEICSVMLVEKLAVLALSETEVKEKGECKFGDVVEKFCSSEWESKGSCCFASKQAGPHR